MNKLVDSQPKIEGYLRDSAFLNCESRSCPLKGCAQCCGTKTLQQLTTTGKAAAYKITRTRILLKADEHQTEGDWKKQAIREGLDVSIATIERVRQQFVEEGFEAVLSYKQRQYSKVRRLDGDKEANLIALTCSDAPEGRVRWTLRLLVECMVELGHVEQISHETIRQTLKKTMMAKLTREKKNASKLASGRDC